MTPHEIENKYLSLEAKLAEFLARQGDYLRIILIALTNIFILYFTRSWWTNIYPDWARFYLLTYRFEMTIFLFTFSYLAIWLRHPIYLMLVMLGAWMYNTYRLEITNPWILVYPFYLIFSYGLIGVIAKWQKLYLKIAVAFVVIAGFLLCMYAAGRVGFDSRSSFMEMFWVLHPEYALISLLYLIVHPAPILALVPTQICTPMPIPIQTSFLKKDMQALKVLWWQGCINAFQGLLFFIICMGLAQIPMSAIKLVASVHQFIYFCIFVSASMNMVTGLIRMYGFDVVSASRFIFFANSPLDVWRRGSVYMYQMILNLIFIPVMRWTRSIILTSLACVLFIAFEMFLMHEYGVKTFYSIFFSEFSAATANAPVALWAVGYFIGGWLLLILLYRYTFEIIFKKISTAKSAWLQILTTQVLVVILMTLILR